MEENKWEERASFFDDKLPNLAKALRSKDLQQACQDIESYDGWIRVITSLPNDNRDVLVTDGKSVWIGDYSPKRRAGEKWSVVYNGAPPFDSTEIIAWTYMPSIPSGLALEKQQEVKK